MRRPAKYLTAAAAIFLLAVVLHSVLEAVSPLIERRAEKALEKILDARVEIEGLRLKFPAGAAMESAEIFPGKERPAVDRGLQLTGVDVDFSAASLIAGSLKLRKISIRKLEANINESAWRWLTSLDPGETSAGVVPEVSIAGGSIRIKHPSADRDFWIREIRASGPPGGKTSATGKIFFDSSENSLDLEMSLEPSEVRAEIYARDFDPCALPLFKIGGKKIDPAELRFREKITGNVSLRFMPESRTLDIREGMLDTADGSLEISSGGAGFDSEGISRAWARGEASRLNYSLIEKYMEKLRLTDSLEAELQEGRVSISGRTRWSRDAGLDYGAEISVRQGAAYFPELETTMESIEADLEIFSPGRINVVRSSGWIFGGRTELTGFLEVRDEKIKQHRLEFGLTEIAGGGKMYALIPAKVRSAIEDMQVKEPEISGRIVLASGGNRLDFDLKAAQAAIPGLPFTINNPAADIKWNSDNKKIRFSDCRGNVNGGSLDGEVVLRYNGRPNADFTIRGTRLPIDAELIQWLDLEDSKWEIEGGYDIEIKASRWRPPEKNSYRKPLQDLQIQAEIKNASASHGQYGMVAENWYGHVSIDKEGTRLTDLRGSILGNGFHAEGNIPADRKSGAVLLVESENITLEEKLYDRLPDFGGNLRRAGVTGRCEIRAELGFGSQGAIPDRGSVYAVIHSMNAAPGNSRASAAGNARLDFSGLQSGEPEAEGSVDLNRLGFDRFKASGMSGNFSYKSGKITVPEARVTAYGGSIKFNDSQINLRDKTWKTEFLPVRIDMENLVAGFGITGRKAPSGSLRGRVNLNGAGLDPETLQGDGKIKITRGMLYDFPVLASVFNVLDLQMPRRSPVTDAHGTFDIGGGIFRINELLLAGGTVPMYMEGWLGLKKDTAFADQEMELLVTAAKSDGLLDRIPVIGWVKHYTLDLFKRLAMQVKVEGKAGDYEVKRLASPVTKPVERMWSLMEQIAPSPPEN